MDLVQKHYPHEQHIFVFDNATTHSKRPASAPSAQKMTKNPSKTFGVKVTATENGRTQYLPNRKPQKQVVQMGPGKLPNGSLQPFYDDFGVFKGMTRILIECSLTQEAKLRAKCKNFKCEKGAMDCCQWHVLYNQPDFMNQESMLQIACKEQGFEAMFLPKFHCELNFIKQCWGHAK